MNATATVEPAKRSLGSTFKKIVNSGEAAIGKLQELARQREQIERKYESVLGECKKVQAEVEAAERDFSNNPTSALVRMLVVLRPQAVVASEIFGALYRTHGARINDEF